MRYILLIIVAMLFLTAGDNTKNSPQEYGAVAVYDLPRPVLPQPTGFSKPAASGPVDTIQSNAIGQSLRAVAFDEGLGIDVLNRTATQRWLERDLFGQPQYMAGWFKMDAGDGVVPQNHYLQFVSDPLWNRVVYGRLGGNLHSYKEIENPGAMAVSPAGILFVASQSSGTIHILQMKFENNVSLNPLGAINTEGGISGMALWDNSTPQNPADDILVISDAQQNRVVLFEARNAGALIAEFNKELKWPRAIAASSPTPGILNIYVVDSYQRRLNHLRFEVGAIGLKSRLTADAGSVFASMCSDYFGQLYVADAGKGKVLKYGSTLQLLDEVTIPASRLQALDIPVGLISAKEGVVFGGALDQLIVLDKWADESGARRFEMGLKVRDVALSAGAYNSSLKIHAFLTDYATAGIHVRGHNGSTVYNSKEAWRPSGENRWSWFRLDNTGRQVAPGKYKLELEFLDAYRQQPKRIETSLYLPLYYSASASDSSGSPFSMHRGQKVQSQNGAFFYDETAIVFGLDEIDPAKEYRLIVDPYLSTPVEVTVNGQSPEKQNNTYLLTPEIVAGGSLRIELTAEQGAVRMAGVAVSENGQPIFGDRPWQVLPHSVNLQANYPNPFNPRTTIPLELPGAAHVQLAVFDRLGRKVAELYNGQMEAGRHYLRFDATGLASGIYFYRLKSGATLQTRKMVLLK